MRGFAESFGSEGQTACPQGSHDGAGKKAPMYGRRNCGNPKERWSIVSSGYCVINEGVRSLPVGKEISAAKRKLPSAATLPSFQCASVSF